MRVSALTIEGSLTGLLTKHLALIRADGVDAVFPPYGMGPDWKPTPTEIVVDELRATPAVLDFARHNQADPPVRFELHEFVARHLAVADPMPFELRIRNPEPPGEVSVQGTFGPWNMREVSETPIAGTYEFRDADLGFFGGIQGLLASDGRFQGSLASIDVQGTTTTPDFGVAGGSHKTVLKSQFSTRVDTKNGDIALEEVRTQLLATLITARGIVAGRQNEKGKTAAIDLAIRNGRIQDLLLLFVSTKRAPLNGVVSLKAKARVPPGNTPFLQKLEMTGDFGIDSALFANQSTQADLAKLSTVARGGTDDEDDPENVVSDLHGHVIVRNGLATFSTLSFRVPGALARMQGTFNLKTEEVNLHGTLFMDATLPQATSGVKSFLLKAINPFLKKNRRGGAQFPVSITGTYQHPSYKADPV
jgi:hypothetical protein